MAGESAARVRWAAAEERRGCTQPAGIRSGPTARPGPAKARPAAKPRLRRKRIGRAGRRSPGPDIRGVRIGIGDQVLPVDPRLPRDPVVSVKRREAAIAGAAILRGHGPAITPARCGPSPPISTCRWPRIFDLANGQFAGAGVQARGGRQGWRRRARRCPGDDARRRPGPRHPCGGRARRSRVGGGLHDRRRRAGDPRLR